MSIKEMKKELIKSGINVNGMCAGTIRATYQFYTPCLSVKPKHICYSTTGEVDKDRRIYDYSSANEYGGW